MKDPLKPRDKITQKMTRDGAITENQTTGETERISKRTQDAELQKTPEQQAAQDAAQLQGAASPTSPLPHVPGAAPKADTGKTERVMEHIEAAHTRKASKKAVRKAQAEATAGTKSSRLQFTDEERAAPELEKYIKKSDKAADRLDKAKAAIPKEKKLVKERTFDEATGKGKTRLHFEEQDKPPGFKEKHSPLSRPAQEAGILGTFLIFEFFISLTNLMLGCKVISTRMFYKIRFLKMSISFMNLTRIPPLLRSVLPLPPVSTDC